MIKEDEKVLEGNLKKTNIVQKSNPLLSLWKSNLTLLEFKILDTYLSKIDSHKPEERTVTFTKGELENLFEVKKINTVDLKKRLINLMGNVIEISDKEEKKGFQLITLFEKSKAEQDDYGIWTVELKCSQDAMKYFFNIENLGYLRYKIRSVINISSLYSYIMFSYIEYNRFRGSWDIEVYKLKEILNCHKEETYKDYKRFNDLVLKKVYKELNEKTECKYSYSPIKKGRNIIALKFTIGNVAPMENKEHQLNFFDIEKEKEDIEDNQEKNVYEERLEFLSGACENAFTINEMAVIYDILKKVLDNDFYDDNLCYDYLQNYYNLLKVNDDRKKIKNKFAYFKKMINIKE